MVVFHSFIVLRIRSDRLSTCKLPQLDKRVYEVPCASADEVASIEDLCVIYLQIPWETGYNEQFPLLVAALWAGGRNLAMRST